MSAATAALAARPYEPTAISAGRAPRLDVVAMSKRFGALQALEKVDLLVRLGTVHALLGENGAGKSTLVKCILGFYRADEGSVFSTTAKSRSPPRATAGPSASAWSISTSPSCRRSPAPRAS